MTTSTVGDARILLPQTIAKDAIIYVRALIDHPMYTGMSRNAQGTLIPEFFIKRVAVSYGGERVAHFEWTSGISRDPYVAFPLRATHEGPITITWTDSKGGEYTHTAAVAFRG